MQYEKIINKLYEMDLDEFYTVGTPNKFHLLNIVAVSKTTNKQYRICVEGGYRCPISYYIDSEEIGKRLEPVRTNCKNQKEIIDHLDKIQSGILITIGGC